MNLVLHFYKVIGRLLPQSMYEPEAAPLRKLLGSCHLRIRRASNKMERLRLSMVAAEMKQAGHAGQWL
jgi:hypothetical protein